MNKMLLFHMSLVLLILPIVSMTSPEPVVACTDNSDCVSLGYRYSCVVYRCTDMHSQQADICAADMDCQHQQQCYHGLCLPSTELQPCDTPSHCAGVGMMGCCGGWCCPRAYERWVEGYAHRVDDYIIIFAGSGVTSPASPTLSASIG